MVQIHPPPPNNSRVCGNANPFILAASGYKRYTMNISVVKEIEVKSSKIECARIRAFSEVSGWNEGYRLGRLNNFFPCMEKLLLLFKIVFKKERAKTFCKIESYKRVVILTFVGVFYKMIYSRLNTFLF